MLFFALPPILTPFLSSNNRKKYVFSPHFILQQVALFKHLLVKKTNKTPNQPKKKAIAPHHSKYNNNNIFQYYLSFFT